MEDLVSVITPAYNSERFIKETILSVLHQTYKNIEMIIVDDCSNDSTCKIIEKMIREDTRIKLIRLHVNSGAAVARNTAIRAAQGRYIAFLDADDIWEHNKLEKQIEFMNNKNIGFSFTSYHLMDEDGKLKNKIIKAPEKMDYNALLKNTIIGCLTVVIDRNIIGEFSMPHVRAGQDTATWLSILKKGYFAYGYDDTLSRYRKVDGSISSNKIKALRRTWNTYRNIEKLDILRSSYYFSWYVYNALIKRL